MTDAQDQARVPWSARDVFYVLLMLSPFFLPFVFMFYFGPTEESAGTGEVVAPVAAITVLLLMQWSINLGVPLIFFRARGYRITAHVLGFRRTPIWKAVGWVLLILMVSYVAFGTLYGWLIERFFSESQLPDQDVTSMYGTSTLAVIATFVVVALVTPVVEELFYRGVIHRGLEQSLGFLPGAILSSLIFMSVHIDYRLFAPIFALGFGFAFLVHKTGSIWPSIGGHFIVNAIGVIGQFAGLGNGE